MQRKPMNKKMVLLLSICILCSISLYGFFMFREHQMEVLDTEIPKIYMTPMTDIIGRDGIKEGTMIQLPRISELDFSRFKEDTAEFAMLEKRFALQYRYSRVCDFIPGFPESDELRGGEYGSFSEGLAVINGYPDRHRAEHPEGIEEALANGEKVHCITDTDGNIVYKLKGKLYQPGYRYSSDRGVWEEDRLDYTYSDGLLLVVQGLRHGYPYSDDSEFFNGYIYQYLDKQGNVVMAPDYEECHIFNGGLARVRKGEYYGYIDKKGELVIPTIYKNAGDFNEGIALVEDDDNWHTIDQYGKVISTRKDSEYDWCNIFERNSKFNNGRAIVMEDKYKDNRWKNQLLLVDKELSVVHAFLQNDRLCDGGFSDGVVAIEYSQLDKDFGNGLEEYFVYNTYYDTNGKRILPYQYGKRGISSFSKGFAIAPSDSELDKSYIKQPLTASIIYNDKKVKFNNYLPVINGRVMAPYKELCKMFGLNVKVDKKLDGLVIQGKGLRMIHKFIDNAITVNGIRKKYSNPSMLILNDVYIPVEMLTDNLDVTTYWDKNTFALTIQNQ